MARQIVPLGNIGKGITPNISDKSSDGWKQLDNVERDDQLGAITCRDGLRSSALYTGGDAPGSSLITTTISPSSSDVSIYHQRLAYSYYSDWVTTTPVLGYNYVADKHYYVNSIVLGAFSATADWSARNPNSKITVTLRKVVTEPQRTYVSGTSGPWYYTYLWTLTDTLGTATLPIGSLGTAEENLVFNLGENIEIEVGQQYYLQIAFTDLTVGMSAAFSVYWRGPYLDYYKFSTSWLIGGKEFSHPYSSMGISTTFIGNAPVTGAIDNLVYAEKYKDTLIAVTNVADKGILNVSEDKLTLKDITPTDCNTPDEQYGVSVLYKDGVYLMSFLSALMQSSYDTNNILYYQPGNAKALLIEQVKENINITTTASAQPPLWYQYGVQYKFSAVTSTIQDLPRFSTLSNNGVGRDSTWTNDAGINEPPPFNAPTPKLTIPIKNLLSSPAVPTEILIYRKAIKNYNFPPFNTKTMLDGQSYQMIYRYVVPDYGNITLTPDNLVWEDNVARVESGEFFIAPNIAYEVVTDVAVYPTPDFLFDYNGRTFALGDRYNKNVVYFSKDSVADFYADNAFTLQLPKEDYFLSAGFELGESAFIASPHSMWRITETSNTLPYYRIEKVRGLDTTGIIAPKTIVQAQGLTYFLAEEGFMAFNGSSANNISLEINNYIKGIIKEYVDKTGKPVNPGTTDCYYAPYLAEAIYDDNKNAIYLAIPFGNVKTNNVAFKYNLLTKSWETLTIEDFRGFVRGLDNGVTVRTNDLIIDVTDTSKVDTVYGVTDNIVSTIETNDTVLPDKARINRIIIYGEGNINFYAYTNRGETPKVTKLGVTLSLDGTDIPLNILGFEFRYKIEGTSSNFKLTASPKVLVTSDGFKSRRDVE